MDNQRPILYISLFFVLFLIWQAWQQDHAPKPQASETAATTTPGDVPPSREDVPQAGTADIPQTGAPAARPAGGSQRIRVVTDVLDLEIDTRGGDIRRADLPTYPVSIKAPESPVRLLDDVDSLYIAQSGLIHDKLGDADTRSRAPDHHSIFQSEAQEFRLRAGEDTLVVPLVWTNEAGIKVTKTYTFHRGRFLVDVEHRVENASESDWSGRQYRQLRHGPARDDDGSRFIYTYTGAAYYDEHYEKLPFDDMGDKPLEQRITNGWVAVLQHYFVSAWVPNADEENGFYSNVFPGRKGNEYIIGMTSPSQLLRPDESFTFKSQFYTGPKLQDELESIAPGLELTTDYGMFTIFSQPLFWLLSLIHGVIGNWGWAIIIVTLLIKLAFYPLSAASYRSMAKMRAVQPKLVALKERYGDDKQRYNQAMMEFYKTEKINPVSGCLPMIIQIPVFIAFYWMLLETVELRQAPFMLWIQDLSTKDPYFVLPILMGITMVIQQRMSPAQLDPMYQKVMMFMPIAFTVFFAFFPSGLVLYWFFNSLFSIAQQWLNTRQMGTSKA